MMTKVLIVCLLFVGCCVCWFDEDGYAFTPHHQVHKNCVHHVESGSIIHADLETNTHTVISPLGEQTHYEPCPHPPTHGRAWKAWTQYHNLDGFTYMSANWGVPPAPAKPSLSEILYYWPGTEPDNNTFVLQPVLQYGSTPAGGGLYWGVASWYVGDRAFYTNLVSASVGDNMFGSMTAFTNGSWAILSQNVNTKESVNLVVNNIITQTYAYCVLEAYNLFNCANEYPEGTLVEQFTNLVTDVAGAPSTPNWVVQTKNPRICNENAVVYSPTSTGITWTE